MTRLGGHKTTRNSNDVIFDHIAITYISNSTHYNVANSVRTSHSLFICLICAMYIVYALKTFAHYFHCNDTSLQLLALNTITSPYVNIEPHNDIRTAYTQSLKIQFCFLSQQQGTTLVILHNVNPVLIYPFNIKSGMIISQYMSNMYMHANTVVSGSCGFAITCVSVKYDILSIYIYVGISLIKPLWVFNRIL